MRPTIRRLTMTTDASRRDDQHDDDASEEIYRGETASRSKRLATALAWICPGLSYCYIGHAIKGVTINLGFVLGVEAFIILLGVYRFFPLLPLLVCLIAWWVGCALVALDVREQIEARQLERGGYLIKSFNNPVAYGVIALMTFFAPILISLDMTQRNLLLVVPVETAAMYPSLLPGDVVLVDRHGFDDGGVELGDVVAVQDDAPLAPVHLLRVTAVEGDKIRVLDGEMVYLEGELLAKTPVELDPPGGGGVPKMMRTLIETNRERRYPVAYSRATTMMTSLPPLQLEEGEMFLLADNRSQAPLSEPSSARPIRDSRDFGPRRVDQVRGAPRYILWSRDPDDDAVRWERIGIKLH